MHDQFSSTDFLESTRLVTLRVQFLVLYLNTNFYVNIFLYYFRHLFFKIHDLQDSKTTDLCHYLVPLGLQGHDQQESLRDYFLDSASPHSRFIIASQLFSYE